MTTTTVPQQQRQAIAFDARPRRRHVSRATSYVALVGALALVLAACGGSSSAATNGPASIRITAPSDGAAVARQFTVELDSSVPIGEPSTGLHHVHLYYDGKRSTNPADYDIAYSSSFTVTRLAPGTHTIEAVIANADHSLTDAHSQITVMVSSAAGAGTTATTSSGGY